MRQVCVSAGCGRAERPPFLTRSRKSARAKSTASTISFFTLVGALVRRPPNPAVRRAAVLAAGTVVAAERRIVLGVGSGANLPAVSGETFPIAPPFRAAHDLFDLLRR
ncbi:hypothetical protein QYE76_020452 [Lolium multiflorum]|uniref:Uncharacterized protein n=1 Tax=Lolium multiflorum TaxID=4521 RepID=A0AAD8R6A7_LOLMU|nr:hypothetical protein QYE76_020452 [Lolium multiflorum]